MMDAAGAAGTGVDASIAAHPWLPPALLWASLPGGLQECGHPAGLLRLASPRR
jgi:hypothetical protein